MTILPNEELESRYFHKIYQAKEDYGPFKKDWKFVVTGIMYEDGEYLIALMYEKYDRVNKAFVSSKFETIEELESFLENFECLGVDYKLTEAINKSLDSLIRDAKWVHVDNTKE